MFNLTEIVNGLLKVKDDAANVELLTIKNHLNNTVSELTAIKAEVTAIKNSKSPDSLAISHIDTYFEGKTAATGYFYGATKGTTATAIPADVGNKKRKTIRVKNNYDRLITMNVYAKKSNVAGSETLRDILLGDVTTLSINPGQELIFDSNDFPVLETAFPGLLVRLGIGTGAVMTGNAELDIMAGV